MSIVHAHIVPKEFSSAVTDKIKPKVKPSTVKPWSSRELQQVVALRAMGVSYKDCAPIIGRSQTACAGVIECHNMYGAIDKRRKELIKEIIG